MTSLTPRLLTIGSLTVEVTTKPRVKNLYVRVAPPDGFVTVTGPEGTNDETIRLFLLRRMSDILRARDRLIRQERQSEREYVAGEAYYLWGKPYMLQIVTHENLSGKRYTIDRIGGRIILNVCDTVNAADAIDRKKAITEWYRQELRCVLKHAVPKCERIVGVKAKDAKIKDMKTKWGSCNRSAYRIWVNLQLVKKPAECLNYVLVHELVHFLESNHTPKFWMLVEKFLPGWREAKKLLSVLPLEYMRAHTTVTT